MLLTTLFVSVLLVENRVKSMFKMVLVESRTAL
jgi:hypothetical protein